MKCCGDCKYHLPSWEEKPKKIESGSGKGKQAFWICTCEKSKNYLNGRVAEDGVQCKKFENKYDENKDCAEWVAACYAWRDENDKKRQVHRNRFSHK